MSRHEQDCLTALNLVDGLGAVRIAALVERYGSPSRVCRASAAELSAIGGIGGVLAARIAGVLGSREWEQEQRRLSQNSARVITLLDEEYPELLRHIYDPPPVLYVRGSLSCLQPWAAAMVGCRRASHYGLRQAARIAQELAQRGIGVISGLARGIDTAAHQGALSGGGNTVAVLGSGLAAVYPPENKRLADRIADRGALVSEFPLAYPPRPGNFPRRNRIISGLSTAVVVVEAAQRSGSLITAQLALEQGKEIFAVPGAAQSVTARGTHQLLKDGAALAESAADIFRELNRAPVDAGARDAPPAGAGERTRTLPGGCARAQVLSLLGIEPLHVDILAQQSGLAGPLLFRYLLELQLEGLAKDVGGKRFVRSGV
ncbi:MAG: DNA-processing protein DprA [Candidatus Omnitrophica bacterium]|nr:DNA-processing protein DprA [Candidatus Omnitrophota bacterium]